MKYLLLVLLTFFLFQIGHGQEITEKTDSLKQLIRDNDIETSTSIHIHMDLIDAYFQNNIDSANYYLSILEEKLESSHALSNDELIKARYLYLKGKSFAFVANHNEALKHLMMSRAIAKQLENQYRLRASIDYLIGAIHYNIDIVRLDSCIIYTESALQFANKIENEVNRTNLKMRALNNLGVYYAERGDFEKVIECAYVMEDLPLSNSRQRSLRDNTLGRIYNYISYTTYGNDYGVKTEEISLAIDSYNKALNEIGNESPQIKVITLRALGEMHSMVYEFNLAYDYFRQAELIIEENKLEYFKYESKLIYIKMKKDQMNYYDENNDNDSLLIISKEIIKLSNDLLSSSIQAARVAGTLNIFTSFALTNQGKYSESNLLLLESLEFCNS
ncbi:MAG: hypothetical protein GY756_25570, partial [bacterium]|nr:hypothetical protein [bacterium]